MSKMHPNFPYGKGVWIWYLKDCLGGDLPAVIKKLKDHDISYVLLKCGDGEYTWTQFTPQTIKAFQDAGIKCYSWMYNYGANPLREAAIANWALDMGADGHVFNAESEYKFLPNNAAAATIMLHKVREKHPEAFLAHAPFPIIDYHTQFPYVTFGKYCDAVMPQMYWGTMGRTPQNVIQWTYEQWSKWEAKWKAEGNGDAVKPLIPAAQGYDNYEVKPAYVLNPADIKAFIDGVAGYMSMNFWSLQHLLRNDCWEAIRDAKMKKPEAVGESVSASETPSPATPNPSPAPDSTPTPPTPVVNEPSEASAPSDTPVTNPTTPEVPVVAPESPVTPSEKPQDAELPAKVEIPKKGTVTVEARHDPNSPGGVDLKVTYGKKHIDLLLEILNFIVSFLRKVVKK